MNKEELDDLKSLSYRDQLSPRGKDRIFNYIEQLEKENEKLKKMCELYSKSLYNADLKKAEVKINKVNQAIDDLLVFNGFNGTTSGIGNVKEELKFYLSDCKTLEEFRNLEKGGSND